ncbi:MAG: Ger(x)C family spore germination C-terminal domain-containing protein [Clostridia bacterium]|nr:Ger(x)C family spore germination C-terminal domain-containing protein [Clostridia bacterium]
MKRAAIFMTVILVAFLSCGCKTSDEPEHQAYAISMSIDESSDGLITIGVQVPTLGAGSSSGESTGKSEYDTYTATSSTFPQALHLLTATIPDNLVLSHLKAVVAGETLARGESFERVISDMIMTNQLYGSSYLIVSKDEALKFIQSQQPTIGTRLSSSLLATLEHYEQTGYAPMTTLYEAYADMNSFYSDPVLAYAATSEKSGGGQSASGSGSGEGGSGSSGSSGSSSSEGGAGGGQSSQSSQYGKGENSTGASGVPGEGTAGEIARTGPDANEYMGCAVTRDGRMTGVLTGRESMLLSFINGSHGFLSYYVDDVAMRITRDNPFIFSVKCGEDALEISLDMSVSVEAMPSRPDISSIERQLTDDIVKLLEKTQRMGVEIFGLSEQAARQFLTIEEYLNYGFRDKFRATPISVRVKASAEKSG